MLLRDTEALSYQIHICARFKKNKQTKNRAQYAY